MSFINRFAVLATGAVAVVAVATGCSSSDDSSSASGASAEACTSFATIQNKLVGLIEAGPGSVDGIETWTTSKNAEVTELKALPEKASGDVASTLNTFVDGIPAETLDLTATDSESGKSFVANAKSVASACQADGTAITLDELPLVEFSN